MLLQLVLLLRSLLRLWSLSVDVVGDIVIVSVVGMVGMPWVVVDVVMVVVVVVESVRASSQVCLYAFVSSAILGDRSGKRYVAQLHVRQYWGTRYVLPARTQLPIRGHTGPSKRAVCLPQNPRKAHCSVSVLPA